MLMHNVFPTLAKSLETCGRMTNRRHNNSFRSWRGNNPIPLRLDFPKNLWEQHQDWRRTLPSTEWLPCSREWAQIQNIVNEMQYMPYGSSYILPRAAGIPERRQWLLLICTGCKWGWPLPSRTFASATGSRVCKLFIFWRIQCLILRSTRTTTERRRRKNTVVCVTPSIWWENMCVMMERVMYSWEFDCFVNHQSSITGGRTISDSR